jgi:hypothetical protein
MRKIVLVTFLLSIACIFSKRSEGSISDFNKILQVDKENKNLKIEKKINFFYYC